MQTQNACARGHRSDFAQRYWAKGGPRQSPVLPPFLHGSASVPGRKEAYLIYAKADLLVRSW